jgi:hypothetical protein
VDDDDDDDGESLLTSFVNPELPLNSRRMSLNGAPSHVNNVNTASLYRCTFISAMLNVS